MSLEKSIRELIEEQGQLVSKVDEILAGQRGAVNFLRQRYDFVIDPGSPDRPREIFGERLLSRFADLKPAVESAIGSRSAFVRVLVLGTYRGTQVLDQPGVYFDVDPSATFLAEDPVVPVFIARAKKQVFNFVHVLALREPVDYLRAILFRNEIENPVKGDVRIGEYVGIDTPMTFQNWLVNGGYRTI